MLLSVGLAMLLMGSTATTAQAATKLTSYQLAELNACSDQQDKKVATGPDHCAMFVAPSRRHGRVVLTQAEQDRMAECIDEQTGGGTEGAGDNCAEFARWARPHR